MKIKYATIIWLIKLNYYELQKNLNLFPDVICLGCCWLLQDEDQEYLEKKFYPIIFMICNMGRITWTLWISCSAMWNRGIVDRCSVLQYDLIHAWLWELPTVPTVSIDPELNTCLSTASASSAAASPASFLLTLKFTASITSIRSQIIA